MAEIPELRPVATIEEMRGQDFLPQWQRGFCVASWPLDLLAAAAILTGETLLSVADIRRNAVTLQADQGLSILGVSGLWSDTQAKRLHGYDLCNKVEGYTINGLAERLTAAGHQTVPLLGVLGTWQLRYGSLEQVLYGPRPKGTVAEHYGTVQSTRLRILQDAVVKGRVIIGEVAQAMSRPERYVYSAAEHLTNQQIIIKRGQLKPAHRIFEVMKGKLGRHDANEDTRALAQACVAFTAQGRKLVRGDELVAEAAKHTSLSTEQLWGRVLTEDVPLSFARFADAALYGQLTSKGAPHRTGYSLPMLSYGPVQELLLGIRSLDDAKYRKDATDALHTILKTSEFVTRLLVMPSEWTHQDTGQAQSEEELSQIIKNAGMPKLTVNKEKTARVFPEWATNAIAAVLEDEEQRKQARRGIEFLERNGLLGLSKATSDSIADKSRRVLIRNQAGTVCYEATSALLLLSPLELRALMRVMGLEKLYFGRVMDRNIIMDGLGLPRTQGLAEYVKTKLLPRVRKIAEKDNN